MAYHSFENNREFNEMIDYGMRRARVERSRAFFGLFDKLTNRGRQVRRLSQG